MLCLQVTSWMTAWMCIHRCLVMHVDQLTCCTHENHMHSLQPQSLIRDMYVPGNSLLGESVAFMLLAGIL